MKTPGHLQWNLGARAAYAYRSVVLKDAAGDDVAVPLEHQLSLDYVAALGLTERLSLGVVLPTIVYQIGDDARGLVLGAEALPKTALGDLAFTAKAALIPAGELGGFALGALARVSLPTGAPTSYASESAATGELRLLGELTFVAVSLQATGGMLVRGNEQSYAGEAFGHELPWGVGLALRPQLLGIDAAGRWQWNLEFRGALSLTPSFASHAQSPSVTGLSARCALGDVTLLAGAELPLNAAVGVPALRAVLGVSYAPRFIDGDGDGTADDKDACSELGEDFDGFEDSDGCPDFDNDGDGVPDDQDKCPREQEDLDEFEDDDGCVDPDNDHDQVPDLQDKCPSEPGPANLPGAEPGCPLRDGDVDGIPDPLDRCPNEAEDRDAFQDEDGCPDPDNDGDGVVDAEDACARDAGAARSDVRLNGCPSPDADGDTWDAEQDRCPALAEDFDGDTDDDGCPDPDSKTKALARWAIDESPPRLELERALTFDQQAGLEAAAESSVRAIATLLNQRPDAVLLVAVRPTGAGAVAEQLALNRSFAVVEAVRRYTHRDDAAETVGWSAVSRLPGAQRSGVGLLVLGAGTQNPGAPANTRPGPLQRPR